MKKLSIGDRVVIDEKAQDTSGAGNARGRAGLRYHLLVDEIDPAGAYFVLERVEITGGRMWIGKAHWDSLDPATSVEPLRLCEHTVIRDGQPQPCDRPIVDPVDEVCDRPGDHVDT